MIADRYEGKRFNGPNDVVVKVRDGAIYFSTDTSFLGMRGGEKSLSRELPYSGFFLVKRWQGDLVGQRRQRTSG